VVIATVQMLSGFAAMSVIAVTMEDASKWPLVKQSTLSTMSALSAAQRR
jgi:hypothetical protein